MIGIDTATSWSFSEDVLAHIQGARASFEYIAAEDAPRLAEGFPPREGWPQLRAALLAVDDHLAAATSALPASALPRRMGARIRHLAGALPYLPFELEKDYEKAYSFLAGFGQLLVNVEQDIHHYIGEQR